MSSNSRKLRRIQWWKQHGKQIDSKSTGADDSKIKPKKFRKTHHDRKSPNKKVHIDTPVECESTDGLEENIKKNRYIVFVGNLPFDLTKEDVIQHFRCTGSNVDFRLMTKKDTSSSKGCGFLELDNVTSYKKALNLHHSTLGGRKINVEVTCGGGGSGEKRTDKLNEKKRKFKKKRAKKLHKPDSNINDNKNMDNAIKDKSDATIKKEPTTKNTESKKEKKNKKRKYESNDDETCAKRKALKESDAITAIVKELELEGMVENKKTEHVDITRSSTSHKEGKKKKLKIKG